MAGGVPAMLFPFGDVEAGSKYQIPVKVGFPPILDQLPPLSKYRS